ncbi:hypothetical protein C4B25_04705 [Mycoplasma todarodis]|uniref:Uncharacterized protein n=2 Tax=Mycoplasma todarodis TaxID=1937191 RepID=A0A4V2NHV6_9MOLU|nr:hypothetical protein C4B25_04705 [Mycoplasma todarodis]
MSAITSANVLPPWCFSPRFVNCLFRLVMFVGFALFAASIFFFVAAVASVLPFSVSFTEASAGFAPGVFVTTSISMLPLPSSVNLTPVTSVPLWIPFLPYT